MVQNRYLLTKTEKNKVKLPKSILQWLKDKHARLVFRSFWMQMNMEYPKELENYEITRFLYEKKEKHSDFCLKTSQK